MGHWSMGVLEYWVLNASLHHSGTPVRWSEARILRRFELFERVERIELFLAAR